MDVTPLWSLSAIAGEAYLTSMKPVCLPGYNSRAHQQWVTTADPLTGLP
jgi:hypothetical protein